MNGVSFASLDGELLGLMKRAGFHTINLSFVSADILTKERMKRPRTRIEFDRIIEEAGHRKLNVIAYGIFGIPGQRVEEMVDTLISLTGRRVLIGPSIYYPTPGTPLFAKCQREGLLPPHLSRWRSTAFPIETKDFSRLDLVTLFRLARAVNFIKGKMDRGELEEGRSWREIYEEAKAKVEVEWMNLVWSFMDERSFFSLRRGDKGKSEMVREESSRKVLDCFFEKAWNSPILKGRHKIG